MAAAIRLFLDDGDPVAVHLLASAAAAIAFSVGEATGRDSSRRLSLDHIKDEYQDAFRYVLDEAYNFMKHGAKDPDATLTTFSPSSNELLLAFNCNDWRRVFDGEVFIEVAVFNAYLAQSQPSFFKNPKAAQALSAGGAAVGLKTRKDFSLALAAYEKAERAAPPSDAR